MTLEKRNCCTAVEVESRMASIYAERLIIECFIIVWYALQGIISILLMK